MHTLAIRADHPNHQQSDSHSVVARRALRIRNRCRGLSSGFQVKITNFDDYLDLTYPADEHLLLNRVGVDARM